MGLRYGKVVGRLKGFWVKIDFRTKQGRALKVNWQKYSVLLNEHLAFGVEEFNKHYARYIPNRYGVELERIHSPHGLIYLIGDHCLRDGHGNLVLKESRGEET